MFVLSHALACKYVILVHVVFFLFIKYNSENSVPSLMFYCLSTHTAGVFVLIFPGPKLCSSQHSHITAQRSSTASQHVAIIHEERD